MAIIRYKKGEMTQVSTHFLTKEFDCHCELPSCNYTLIESDLIDSLEEINEIYSKLTIHSGFRCTAHNDAIGGKPGSYHLIGKAADVSSALVTPKEISMLAQTVPRFSNGGIGTYSSFTHLDVRGYKARWGLEG